MIDVDCKGRTFPETETLANAVKARLTDYSGQQAATRLGRQYSILRPTITSQPQTAVTMGCLRLRWTMTSFSIHKELPTWQS